MKVVGIIGYKKSGKTTLGVRLAHELSKLGKTVGVIKHVHDDIMFPDTDTSKYRSYAGFVAAVSSDVSQIILKGKRDLYDLLQYVDMDIVIVEGFKKEKTYPKIVCLRSKNEEKELVDGLEILTASFEPGISDFEIMNDEHVGRMAALVLEKAFYLPNLDCRHCGYEGCYDFGRQLVKGQVTLDQCVSLNSQISITIDGVTLPLNSFDATLSRNTILSAVPSLKGFKKGVIDIRIN